MRCGDWLLNRITLFFLCLFNWSLISTCLANVPVAVSGSNPTMEEEIFRVFRPSIVVMVKFRYERTNGDGRKHRDREEIVPVQ